MTRTFRIDSQTSHERDARLARLFSAAKSEARTVYYAAREAHAIYEAESRALRRDDLAAAMRDATTRDYATVDDFGACSPEPGTYPECSRCPEAHAGCVGNSEVTCYVHERYQTATSSLPEGSR